MTSLTSVSVDITNNYQCFYVKNVRKGQCLPETCFQALGIVFHYLLVDRLITLGFRVFKHKRESLHLFSFNIFVLSGSCEIHIQGDENFLKILFCHSFDFHIMILAIHNIEKRIWYSFFEKLLWPELVSDLSVSWLLSWLVFCGQNTELLTGAVRESTHSGGNSDNGETWNHFVYIDDYWISE